MKIEKIVLIGFNRSHLLIENYKYIRSHYNGLIDLYIDGARDNNYKDQDEQNNIKVFFRSLDDGNLTENYSSLNRGCRNGVIYAITEAFKSSNNCLIIEDDCFVSPTFFDCFNYFLDQQEKNLVVAAQCLFNSPKSLQYYISHSIQVWGWGCTKDVWEGFINNNPEDLFKFWNDEFKGNFFFKWTNFIKSLIAESINTWDYSFKSYLISKDIKTVSFNKSMVDNKGFDSGTHKTTKSKIPFFTNKIVPTNIILNQKLVKKFNNKEFLSVKNIFIAISNYFLFQLGFFRIGKKIKPVKSLQK
jgi:hypothetical protein